MASFIIRRINNALHKFDQLIGYYMGGGFPPGALCAVDTSYINQKIVSNDRPKLFDLDSLKDGFLFAVPVSRRSVERRRSRKFGFKQWVWKPFVPKTNILTCLTCGHHHMADVLCPNCYNTVMEETNKLKDEITAELGLKPIEKEVVVLYEGESNDNFWKNQQIVEVPRKRPDWFQPNLLQSTTKKEDENNQIDNTIRAKISDS